MKINVPSKWVVAGEHSYVRGHGVVVIPHRNFSLTLEIGPEFTAQKSDLKTMESLVEKSTKIVYEQEKIRELVDSDHFENAVSNLRSGSFVIQSDIPLASGLGSSVALCVSVVRALVGPSRLRLFAEDAPLNWARQLAEHFHGQSRGVDIAPLFFERPIFFTQEGGMEEIEVRYEPDVTFHNTGLKAQRRSCIEQVEDFFEARGEEGELIDMNMATASELAKDALESERDGADKLSDSMALSWSCYERWGLIPKEASHLRANLLAKGAIGVRMIGSGRGGYLAALWREGEA